MAGKGVAQIKITGNVTEALAALDTLGIRAEITGKKAEDAFGDKLASKVKTTDGTFSKLGGTVTSLGLPFGETFDRIGHKIGEADTKGQKFFQTLSTIGGVSLVAGAAGVAAIAGEAVKLGVNMQQTTANIAAGANIPIKAAQGIQSAFNGLSTSMKTTFSGVQLGNAYAPVAAQLATVSGKALTAAQALSVMKAASDLAEASGSDLTSTTADLAKVMQAYGLGAAQAGQASDIVYNTSKVTGQSVDTLAQTTTRLKSSLGVLAPSLGDTSALMVDLTEHGETGRQAVSAVGSAMQTLLATAKPTVAVTKDLTSQHDAVQKSLLAVSAAETKLSAARAVEAAKPTAANASKVALAENAVAQAKLASAAAQDKLNVAMQPTAVKLTAAQVEAQKLGLHLFDASGKFVGMQSVITQLQPKLEKMTQQQQLQTTTLLFGAPAARKMLDVVLAGPKAYAQATAAVTAHGAAHDAAEKKSSTLQGQMEKLKGATETLGGELGQALIPKLVDLENVTAEVIGWFTKHTDVAKALAGVIGGVLAVAVGAFTVNKLGKMVSGVKDAIDNLGKLESAVKSAAGKLLGLGDDASKAEGKARGAATNIEEGGAKAGADLDAAGKTAKADIEQGASSAESSMAEGGKTAGASEAAGGGTAETEMAAGGATAESELAAGGKLAGEEEAAGGAGGGAAGKAGGAAGLLKAVGGGSALVGGGLVAGGVISGAALTEGVYQGLNPSSIPYQVAYADSYGLGGPGDQMAIAKQFGLDNYYGPTGIGTINPASWGATQTTSPSGVGLLSKLKHYASGGHISAGQPFIGNEIGQEMFLPDASGTVIPHHDVPGALAALAGSGTNIAIEHLELPGVQNPRQFADAMRQQARVSALAGGSFRSPH